VQVWNLRVQVRYFLFAGLEFSIAGVEFWIAGLGFRGACRECRDAHGVRVMMKVESYMPRSAECIRLAIERFGERL
jgi:hypothetical protein